jgi:tetratricopeptide (TPR) repeat protein
MSLLSNNSDSIKLEKAWALDQRALFDKNKKRQKKLWSESVNTCKEILKKYKTKSADRIQILLKLATIYQHQKKFLQAKKYLDIVDREWPKNAITTFNYGNLYRAMNKPEKAIPYYKQAIKLSEKLSNGKKLFKKELERYLNILDTQK